MSRKADRDHPLDVIGEHIDQSQAIVTLLLSAIDEKTSKPNVSDKVVHQVIFMLNSSIYHASEAFEELLADEAKERRAKRKKA